MRQREPRDLPEQLQNSGCQFSPASRIISTVYSPAATACRCAACS